MSPGHFSSLRTLPSQCARRKLLIFPLCVFLLGSGKGSHSQKAIRLAGIKWWSIAKQRWCFIQTPAVPSLYHTRQCIYLRRCCHKEAMCSGSCSTQKYTHLVPDRTTHLTNTIYSDIKGIPINSGESRRSLISPWHQDNAFPQECFSWSPGIWSPSPTCPLHPVWPKDI